MLMTIRRFSLKPFRGEGTRSEIKITGSIGRRANLLSASCALLGNLSELAIPAAEASPTRRDRLWEETCLEFLLGVTDSERYWEFNLSPSGDWNVYRFTSRREGMREEPAFASLPFGIRREPEALRVSLDLDIGKIIPARKDMEIAVAAVLKTVKGRTSHWALAHFGPRPDFHRRDGFLIGISAK
jgi:hypothetical protein